MSPECPTIQLGSTVMECAMTACDGVHHYYVAAEPSGD